MSTDDLWIIARISESSMRQPLVTETVSTRMGELLKEQFSEGPLTYTELAHIAKDLIADMAPAPPKTEAEQ